MKRITIGRSNDCDVVIFDETDNVSRKHLVISFDFFGKMRVSDTSSNGTFINGVRMIKGASIPVTRNDKIRLGSSIDLDWSMVQDPYNRIRIISAISLIALVIAGLCICGLFWYKNSLSQAETPKIELLDTEPAIDNTWNKDSTNKVAPVATTINVKGKKNSPSLPAGRKKKATGSVSKKKKTVDKTIERKSITTEKDDIYLDSTVAF